MQSANLRRHRSRPQLRCRGAGARRASTFHLGSPDRSSSPNTSVFTCRSNGGDYEQRSGAPERIDRKRHLCCFRPARSRLRRSVQTLPRLSNSDPHPCRNPQGKKRPRWDLFLFGAPGKIGSNRLRPILGAAPRTRVASAPKTLARSVERKSSSDRQTRQIQKDPAWGSFGIWRARQDSNLRPLPSEFAISIVSN